MLPRDIVLCQVKYYPVLEAVEAWIKVWENIAIKGL